MDSIYTYRQNYIHRICKQFVYYILYHYCLYTYYKASCYTVIEFFPNHDVSCLRTVALKRIPIPRFHRRLSLRSVPMWAMISKLGSPKLARTESAPGKASKPVWPGVGMRWKKELLHVFVWYPSFLVFSGGVGRTPSSPRKEACWGEERLSPKGDMGNHACQFISLVPPWA